MFRFTYECGTCDLFTGVSLVDILMWLCQALVVIMLLGYVAVVISVKLKKSMSGNRKRPSGREAQLVLDNLFC
ncbi:unnamed protein product [Enterobius vermicularis]|uniref:Copper transporter n=1 Tax=Enterobius vermicularis TaxID=51028 RepID=A0A0N4VJV9_ENTVE|nr:unnamed protein product [Enterobius vermicularis]